MTISELIGLLREFDSRAQVYLKLDSRRFAPPVWVGLMDTAGLFDEESLCNQNGSHRKRSSAFTRVVCDNSGRIASVKTRPTAALGRLIRRREAKVAAMSTGATTP